MTVEVGQGDSIPYEEVVERVLTAYGAISMWASRDFKRRTLRASLTATQLSILHWADSAPGITTSQLAERLELSVPTVVRAIDALERKGFVIRRRSARDRREVELAVTPEGTQARSSLERARRERLLGLLIDMSPDEVAGLLLGFEGLAAAALRTEQKQEVG